MKTNLIKTGNGYRRITISRNEVKISDGQKVLDYGTTTDVTLKEKYQIVNEFSVDEKHEIAQCVSKGEITVFSITQCQKICQVPQAAIVEYSVVGNELFVKIVDDEREYIYDEIGNLIEADLYNHLSVVFGGCELLIKKINKSDGREKYYNFEGYLVG